ncbi:hypothetical protein P3S67_004726 [Capsicum chacoense]
MSTSESSSTELLHAQAQIWNYIFNFVTSSAVSCALQLGILDILYKHVQSGFLNQHEDHFSLTPASRLLAKNEPFNVRSLLLLNHGPVFSKAWPELSAWFQNHSPTPFDAAHEKSLWNYIEEEEPRILGDIFNDALASGTGTVSMAIAKAFPNIKCTVLDLPHVIGDLKGGGNLEFVAGDMFDQILHANAILLKLILRSARLDGRRLCEDLKKCKESIPSREKRGKVIIIDTVLDDPKKSNEFVRAQHNMDMLMMVLYAAKERTKKEWEKLFTEYKIVPALGLRRVYGV